MKKGIFSSIVSMAIFSLIMNCGPARQNIQNQNTLSDQEKKEGWQLLFDGKSLLNWTGTGNREIAEAAWKIENGILVSVPAAERSEKAGGDIITKDQYSNFEFKTDFRINGRANSGIKYFIQPGSTIGFEYQIIDERKELTAAQHIADLYDLIHSDSKHVNPAGEWNQAHIIVIGNNVEHWLNGEKVLECDRDSEDFRARISKSKFKDEPDFGRFIKGHILLQDHDGGVDFRNIKIKVIE
ncbi:DUF1080 domain-containing protein [candidate division KSB1 bacterium]|nr:DUF1080 domain-containing protein [candidate division KSB1 bacterium]